MGCWNPKWHWAVIPDLRCPRSNIGKKVRIPGMGRAIGRERKWCSSIGSRAHFVTLDFELTHNHDLIFPRSNFKVYEVVYLDWVGRLGWNEKDVSRLSVGPTIWPWALTVTSDFPGQLLQILLQCKANLYHHSLVMLGSSRHSRGNVRSVSVVVFLLRDKLVSTYRFVEHWCWYTNNLMVNEDEVAWHFANHEAESFWLSEWGSMSEISNHTVHRYEENTSTLPKQIGHETHPFVTCDSKAPFHKHEWTSIQHRQTITSILLWGRNHLYICKLHHCNNWSLGMDK